MSASKTPKATSNAASTLTASGFQRITSSYYLYKPQSSSIEKDDSTAPEIILVFGWGNAPPKAVAKYTTEYQNLYPQAKILLFLTSFAEIFLHTSKRHSESVDLAVKTLISDISLDPTSPPRILVHLFSNAGSFKLRELTRYYRHEVSTRSKGLSVEPVLPVRLIVLDSSPGNPSFYRRMVGTQTQLPRQVVLYWLGSVVMFLILCTYALVQFVFQRTPILEQVWLSLNESSGQGQLVDQRAKRIYIYSKTDDLVDWQDVVGHASDAKEKGFQVQVEEFSRSKHVAHVLVDRERYWSLIKNGWAAAVADAA